jgi:hypothetical protein
MYSEVTDVVALVTEVLHINGLSLLVAKYVL